MNEYFLGIDIGTSSVKALAITATGNVLTSKQVAYPLTRSGDDQYEQDPEIVWNAFVNVINHIEESIKSPAFGVAISSAMHSLILIDKNHKPLTPSITWADQRAAAVANKILRSSVAEMLYEQSGTPIHAMSPLCKIIWFKENDPEKFSQAAKFISIKEYIWYKLFGTYEIDYAMASATGLLDITKLDWNDNAISLAGINQVNLSQIVSTDHVRSYAGGVASLQTKAGVRFVISATDGCMANLGSFATDDKILAVTIGTSGAVRITSKRPIYNFDAMTFNYLLNEDTFICGGPTNNGGVVLKWFAKYLLNKTVETPEEFGLLLADLADIEPGSSGLLFLPYVFGERAPIWNSEANGVFYGIHSGHTQKHFTRAVVEGISMALYSIFIKMNVDIDRIHVSGGFVRSHEWLQIIADVFNKDVHLINTGDASALGAAYHGMKTLGMIHNYDQVNTRITKIVQPNSNDHEIYKQSFQKFIKVYQSLSSLMN
jgi:gluconokinase